MNWDEKEIFRVIDGIAKVEPGPEATEQALERVRREIVEKGTKRSKFYFKTGRMIMNYRATKFATAAVLIIGVIVGIYFMGGVDKVVLAEVVEKVEQITTFSYRMKMHMSGMEHMPKEGMDMEIHATISSDIGMRMDSYMKGRKASQSYVLLAEGTIITVIPDQKKYMRMKLTDEMLEKMEKESGDPKSILKEFLKLEYTELGRDTIDGIEVEGFEIADPKFTGGVLDNMVARLWVDVETNMPVRMEMKSSGDDGEMQVDVVMDEYEWGIEIDPSEFEPRIPDDYSLMADVKVPSMDGENVVEGLRTFAEMTGGRYPSTMSVLTASKEARQGWKKKRETEGIKGQPSKAELEKFMSVQMIFVFYAQLVQQDKDPAYYGETVTPEDADAVLMRWKIDDGQYRIIYGDLSTEEVSAEKLAELEEATAPKL